MNKKALKAGRSLRLYKDVWFLLEEKNSCTMVLDESEYIDKLNTLLESRVYEALLKPKLTDTRY
jgi:hypothetical protein